MARVKFDASAEETPDFEKNRQIFSTVDPKIIKEKSYKKNILTKQEQRALDSYKMKLYKLSNNRFLGYRNEGDRCRSIDALVTKLRTGWPWKNNERLITFATPELVAYGEALSRRILDVEKCKKRGEKTEAGKLN